MATQPPPLIRSLAALAFALSCVGLMIFTWTQFRGTVPFASRGYQVRALLPESGLLVPGADVRIAGVNVGSVTAVDARGVNSLVTITIQPRFAPIPTDTRAVLRKRSLIGEAYLELSWGERPGRTLPDGGTIASSHIQPAQQLDQVLSAFGPRAQRSLRALLQGTYAGLAGRGQTLNDALGNLAPGIANSAVIADGLDRERGAVRQFVHDTGSVLSTLGDRANELQQLIIAGDRVFSATAAHNTDLTATVNALPPFLTQLRATLSTLDTTLSVAHPTLTQLLAAGPLVKPALTDLIRLSGPAVALLRRAPGLLDDTVAALPPLTRFITAFRGAVHVVLPAAQNIVPLIDLIGNYSPELISSMANLAAGLQATAPANTTTAVGNAASGSAHYLRVVSPINSEMIFGQSTREPDNRHNAYPAPGYLSRLAGGLSSSDCRNTHDQAQIPVLGSKPNVPCTTATGWPFDGISGYYPHVTRAAP